jgi:hypothetical protein
VENGSWEAAMHVEVVEMEQSSVARQLRAWGGLGGELHKLALQTHLQSRHDPSYDAHFTINDVKFCNKSEAK